MEADVLIFSQFLTPEDAAVDESYVYVTVGSKLHSMEVWKRISVNLHAWGSAVITDVPWHPSH